MKKIIINACILLCISQTLIAQRNKNECNCIMLDSILSIETLHKSTGISDNLNKPIRIIDTKYFLKKCLKLKSYSYYLGNHGVGISNKIPLDINTGLFADIVIIDIKQKKDKAQVELFFVNNQCEANIKHKYMCTVFFLINKDKIVIERVNFSHIK